MLRNNLNLSLEGFEKRRAELLGEIEEDNKRIEKYRVENKIEFFKPIEPYQTKILGHIYAGKTVITLQGANGIGKTVIGAVIVGSACLGIQPWDKRETVWGRKPIKARIICSDWEKHAATVIVPSLKEWLPVGQYETSKNNLGIESFFRFKNNSTIELLTNKQDTKDHEGWEGDIVWADEPLPRDKFVANLRGLRKEIGVFLLTMTAVSEPWILDDIVRNTHSSYASVTQIPIRSNPYLTEKYIEMFSASLKESEKIARIDGGWLNLIGLIWPEFNPDIHLIDDFKIPTDWPVVPFIDFHPAKPQAISFYATDPQERWYVIDEEWKHFSPEETADYLIRSKISNAWRIEEAFIDPLSKGDTAYVKNRFGDVPDSFSIIKERLWRHGIELNVATKDKSSGILNIEKMLMGPNKMPLLFFFRSLTNKIKDEGTVWEIQRWTYDSDTGKPRDEADHFVENLYRMTLTGIKYRKISTTPKVSEIDFDVFAKGYGIKESEREFNVFGE